MNVLEDIVYYSWLNKFLFTNDELVLLVLDKDKYYVIQLDLTIKEVSYIKNNFDKFITILENILFTYNKSWDKYFKNITFNTIKRWNEIFNNCIFLYDSKNNKNWFIKTNNFIQIWNEKKKKKEKKSIFLWNTIFDKIWKLIEKNKLSYRNLMKMWINDTSSRKIYNFLKNNWIIIISKYNHTHKTYNLEKYKKISKERLYAIISGGV